MKGSAVIVMGLVLAYSPVLLAKSDGKYIGVMLTQSKATIEDMTIDTLPYSYFFTGRPNFSASNDNSSTNSSWLIYAGYTFNRYLSLEVSTQSMGDFSRDGSASGLTDPSLTAAAGLGLNTNLTIKNFDRLTMDGYGIAALASLPVDNYMSVYARLGGFYWTGKLERSTTFYRISTTNRIVTYLETQNKSGLSPVFGVGLQIDITRNVTLRGEWSIVSGVGSGLSTGSMNVSTAMLGAQIYF